MAMALNGVFGLLAGGCEAPDFLISHIHPIGALARLHEMPANFVISGI